MEPIKYVAGVIIDNRGCFLLQFNKKLNEYVFPGGKVEAQETSSAALYREMIEELGVTVHGAYMLRILHHEIDGQPFVGYYYMVTGYEGIVKNNEPLKCTHLFFATKAHLLSLVRSTGPEAIIVNNIDVGREGGYYVRDARNWSAA